MKVIIQGSKVSSDEINICIEKYKEIKADNSLLELQIIAENEIIDFDFSLIGHFILFKEELPKLSITVILQKNYAIDSDSITWKLKQQMVHAYYSTRKDIFSLIDGSGEMSIGSVDKRKTTGHFALSKRLLPIIYLNNKSYKCLFETSVNFEPLKNLDLRNEKGEIKKDDDGLYKACRKALFKHVKEENYLQILSQVAFYHILMEAKMLRFYLYDELDETVQNILSEKGDKDSFRVGVIQDVDEKKEYREALMPVFNEIKEALPFSKLLFFTFISSELIENKTVLKEQVTIIKNLWEFTKELVYGINELAKNVIEHTDTRKGVITGFVNSKKELELSVFDFGKKGIMKTFEEHLLLGSNAKEEYIQQDINAFNEGKFSFTSFFDLKNGYILNEQANRATAHLGLLFTYQLIKKNNDGNEETIIPFKVVSPNKMLGMDTFPDESVKNELPNTGTYYKITLSLKDRKYKPYKHPKYPILPKSDLNPSTLMLFEKNDLCVIRPFEKIQEQLSLFNQTDILKNSSNNNKVTPEQRELNLWQDIQQKMNRIALQKKWICINFFSVWKDEDASAASELFRFLGRFELNYPNMQLIIFNIKTNVLLELNRINKYYVSATKVDYWNEKKAILIYSYEEIEENKFYFTDILWGKNKTDFDKINAHISKYHFNLHSLDRNNDFDWQQEINLDFLRELSTIFDGENLIPFDRFITDDKGNKPLLRFNPETLLKIAMENQGRINVISSTAIKEYLSQLAMHKLKDSHFRLGSKIHITDFYYAKSFFQNSYFAQRLALGLTHDIIIQGELDNKNTLTLIGYGLYSELLICYVREFLKSHYKNLEINTNTVTDTEECSLNKPAEANSIFENIIIIVPIATTFSTSIKIRNMLIEKYNPRNIIEPYYNIFVVVNETFPKESLVLDLDKNKEHAKQYAIFKAFGWEKIDTKEKTVKTKVFDSNPTVSVCQRYYAHQPTTWHEVGNCKVCFPNEKCEKKEKRDCLYCKIDCASTERPLFTTDKTSLIPELILEWPIARFIEQNENRPLILTPTTIKCGHIKRGNNHYRYYFNNDELWNKNRDNVKEWLEKKVKIENPDNAVILAPCHFSNADFVEMVNQIVFGNSATIIHYDSSIENPQNFKNFYDPDKTLQTKKIYFVDDVLTSGNTFFTANTFLKHVCVNDKKQKIEFEKCFFFINRAGYFEYNDIINELGENKILSFANLHFPYIKLINNQCSLCAEMEKYKKLYENSYLTRIKLHFLEEKRKLEITDIHDSRSLPNETEKRKRILKRVEAIHRIYDLFSEGHKEEFKKRVKDSFKVYTDFKKWVDFLIENTKEHEPFKACEPFGKLDEKLDKDDLLTETEKTVLKSLTQSPFCDYKNIREATFCWVIALLEKKIKSIIESSEIKSLSELKLLIRRATLLNSNYITSYKMLFFLEKLYSEKDVEEKMLLNFSKFFVAQVNELLYKDAARSEQFEKRFELFDKERPNPKEYLFRQLMRMLREENAAKIRVLAEELEKKGIATNEKIIGYLRIQKKPRNLSSGIIKFLQAKLEIKRAINEKDDYQNEKGMESEIEKKLNTLSKFIKTPQGGCFVIVKYKNNEEANDPYHLLYNEGEGSAYIAQNENDYLDKNKSIIKFLCEGQSLSEDKKSTSIVEFHKYGKDVWNDLFSNKEASKLNGFPIPQDSNRLLLLRIDRDRLSEEKDGKGEYLKDEKGKYQIKFKGQAVIGFYFIVDDSDTTLTDIERIRYLLLLRGDISEYIKKVVEKNDVFRNLVESEKKRKDILSTEHHYWHHIKDLYLAMETNDRDKIKFFYDQVHTARNIKLFMENGKIEDLQDIIELNIKNEIESYCKFIFEEDDREKVKIDIDDSLAIHFSAMLFREIFCEYLKNINDAINIFGTASGSLPYAIIEAKLENDKVKFYLKNNFILTTEQRKRMPIINKTGFLSSDHDGLYTNSRLLAKIDRLPTVIMKKTEDQAVGEFAVTFCVKNITLTINPSEES
jgi:hypoxanthine-guanine phosphoribosyltransferase